MCPNTGAATASLCYKKIYVVLLMPTLLLVLVDRVQLRIPLVLDPSSFGHHEPQKSLVRRRREQSLEEGSLLYYENAGSPVTAFLARQAWANPLSPDILATGINGTGHTGPSEFCATSI